MSKATVTTLLVWLDGQEEPCEVQADQRDFAAWEASPLNDGARELHIHTIPRHWAWTAMRRAGKVDRSVTWAKFNEELCVQAQFKPIEEDGADAEDDAEDEQGLDPGRMAVPGGR